MPRLIIHAGFPKTGSSAIQLGLGSHFEELRSQRYFLFGDKMRLGRIGPHPDQPLWYLEMADRTWPEGQTFDDIFTRTVRESGPDDTLLLSAENLEQPGMPRLFAGVDTLVDTQIVFYMRPQTDWIPSAWKQWELKKGSPLKMFIKECLKHNYPSNAKSIERWAAGLPRAKIIVRPFFHDVMVQSSPVIDFFKIIGFEDYDEGRLARRVNPSIDYSLLHVMLMNAGNKFLGEHDNQLFDRLDELLPEKYKSTNIAMLSDEAAEQIERHFRDENLYILQAYCGLSQEFYEQHYRIRLGADNYMTKTDQELVQRAFKILAEVRGSQWASGLIAASFEDIAKGSR